MPSVSRAQQQAMAIAEHQPSKLHAKNKGLLKMSHSQLHDFAATPRKGLPARAAGKKKPFGGPRKKKAPHFPGPGMSSKMGGY
jgi:hypothetical protein